jgi:aryl-alcohol dehydrogenase-like predicted oxidoreductase
VSERDAFEVLDAAVDAGITFIDTADVYGSTFRRPRSIPPMACSTRWTS